jgi:hypothetical protein
MFGAYQEVSLERSNQGEWDGWTCCVYGGERGELYKGFWWGKLNERDYEESWAQIIKIQIKIMTDGQGIDWYASGYGHVAGCRENWYGIWVALTAENFMSSPGTTGYWRDLFRRGRQIG